MDTDSTDSPSDIRRASADGYDADGVWMSFAELGRARGISRASAARLVRRRKWRKRTDNHGVVHVFVPAGADEPADRQPGHPTEALGGHPTDVSHAISALETAVTTLREQLERSEQRADRAELATTELRDRLGLSQAALDQAQADARAARGEAEALRAAEAARKARGLLARLRAAVRGRE
jgi:hypothetical protein